ncbi:MAG: B12-binding domain-containing radical SAM protein, partial [Sandaracinaceae bacterium]|nr:B12-binding domain-containing radical SAM protein [Sandaracinaceae bacterium]
VGTVGEARACNEDCLLAIEGAAARAAARPTKVVLVHLPRFRNRFDELRLPSLGLARLAAYLRGYGFEVRVVDLEATHVDLELSAFTDDPRVDAFLDGTLDDELEARLGELYGPIEACVEGYCLVGFSVVDYFGHFQMNLASCLAQRVKARTGQHTVLGGERDQVDPDRALARACFDYVVDGDGGAALFELACLEAYQDREARRIDAVWSRHEGEIVRRPMVRSHLNAMPRPDFDGVPLERYRRAPSQDLLRAIDADGLFAGAPREAFAYLPYGFVKGCTADCTFCSAKEHLDVQAPEKTVDELMALAERYGVRDFVFLNNLVNLGPRWLERFCRLLVERRAGLQWTDSCRPTGISESLAALMRESGCLLLNYGAESGSDRVLERMQKGLGRADILATLRATHGAGILNRVNLIAGYLHETPEDVDLTISLVETLSGQIDVIGCFQGFYLFPGMGVDPAKEGIVVRDGLDRLKTGQATLAYDEVGGLRWEQKRDAIDASRNRILGRIEELGIRTIDKIDEHDLFWLSRLTRDKATVRKYILRNPDTDAARRPALRPGGQRGRVEA